MLRDSLLRHLIAQNYSKGTLTEIRNLLAAHHSHDIVPGGQWFAAGGSQSTHSVSGYQYVWVRDNVMIANSFRLRGQLDPAISCVHGLTQFFRTQLHRFREVIADPINTLKEGANCRPHIRFAAQNMAELPEKWPHAQNDSLGQVLWFRFVLANTNVTPLTSEDAEVYALFPPYFEAIRYWQDRDSGAWEEGRKVNNSSVGAVVAGLAELLRTICVS